MTVMQWFDGNDKLAPALAAAVTADLRAVLEKAPRAALAVSGGNSPVPVFEVLREADLDWPRIVVTLVDERWVPESDPGSNAALVKAHLLQGRAAAADFLPLYTGAATAQAAEDGLAEAFNGIPQPFAALILGMGEDGHTASLFPASPKLQAGLALDGTVATTPPYLAQIGAVEPVERISLTLPWILNSLRVYLQFGGASKVEVYNKAMQGRNPQYPVSYVLSQTQTPVSVFAARS
ncbi:6-phosphogluconolactonase [Candidatus Methylospira mobilis]|uniref:6-phosphogluconolactonase n=1 Tax=Candidatus Methylospira mobilis TaxID=1808979 RepID=A0A5Q0BLA4_9GAMM|nr:6-phosphogluconolactonase [Candidatus Methylospira mobilis]QFY42546.1 6-phosphogluconolactonase [Candidatus Methylospira mobilis]WNV04340.1 6-phosphogluconolactonase [Candidatus Methylospira mobilis]